MTCCFDGWAGQREFSEAIMGQVMLVMLGARLPLSALTNGPKGSSLGRDLFLIMFPLLLLRQYGSSDLHQTTVAI